MIIRLVTDGGGCNEGYWSTCWAARWPSAGEEMIVRAQHPARRTHRGARPIASTSSAAGSVAGCARRRNAACRYPRGLSTPFYADRCRVAGSEKILGHRRKSSSGSQPSLSTLNWPFHDTNFQMNPPLRTARTARRFLEGLADGTIEILCSDHAPHCDY